jgi:hypothetical protein
MAWISAADFAGQLGVSPQAVRKAIAEGRLKDAVRKQGRAWLIDDESAMAEWDRNTSPAFQRGRMRARQLEQQQHPAPGSDLPASSGGAPHHKGPSHMQAMALRTAYQAKLLELDLKQRQGELVPKADVERVWFEEGRRVRDAVRRTPQQMIGDIARAAGGLTQEQRAEVLLILERHLVKTLEGLAGAD